MVFYFIVLLGIVTLGGVFCTKYRSPRNDKIFLFLSGLVLTGISAIRYDVGFDYSYIYAPYYEKLLNTPFSQILSLPHEKGFVLFEYFISLFSNNFQAVFVGTSILCIALFWFFIYKYSTNPFASVVLFITLGLYYCSMNFVRQTIAAGIFLFSINYIKDKKIWQYIGVVILASLFHKSALIMLPFYFILQIKITPKILMLYSTAVIFIFATSNWFLAMGIRYFFPWYSMNDMRHIAGGNIITTVFLPTLFFVFIFIVSTFVVKKKEQNTLLNIYTSYAFFSMFFFMLGAKHSVLDRFSLYFEPMMIVAIPKIFSELIQKCKLVDDISAKAKIFKRISYGSIGLVFVACFTYHYLVLRYDGHAVAPYKIIWNQPFYAPYVEELENLDNADNAAPLESDSMEE